MNWAIAGRLGGNEFDIMISNLSNLEEQSAMLPRVRALLDAALRPDGYNIGINDGAAAGQTVMHVHMHVIPRYRGDRPDLGGTMREGDPLDLS